MEVLWNEKVGWVLLQQNDIEITWYSRVDVKRRGDKGDVNHWIKVGWMKLGIASAINCA